MVPDDATGDAGAGAGEGTAPHLELDGFSGPLDHLLALARARDIDLARVKLPALLDQLATALAQVVPLAEKADWVVMVAWLLQLRSRLLLPADAPAQQAAEAEAERLRARLTALGEAQALAAWLGRRPQLGHEVFCRGTPELLGTWSETAYQVDVIAFRPCPRSWCSSCG